MAHITVRGKLLCCCLEAGCVSESKEPGLPGRFGEWCRAGGVGAHVWGETPVVNVPLGAADRHVFCPKQENLALRASFIGDGCVDDHGAARHQCLTRSAQQAHHSLSISTLKGCAGIGGMTLWMAGLRLPTLGTEAVGSAL